MTIAGYLYWTKGQRGPIADKRPADYRAISGEVPPLAKHPLTADEYALTIATLAGMYPAPAEVVEERVKLGEVATATEGA